MAEVRSSRHRLMAAALARADWTRQELWMGYIGVGGVHDAFDLDAYLAGLVSWGVGEQDVLAVTVNERLYDLYLADRVPVELVDEPLHQSTPAHVVQVLNELLRDQSRPAGT